MKTCGAYAITAVALVVMVASHAGCGRSSSKQSAARQAQIVISGDTAGWIVPCGCTANQSGGLLRRGSYLQQLRRDADVLYADAGGAAAGDSSYQQAKFKAILNGERLMGVAAHNLGRSELAFGPDVLRELQAGTSTPFISANARATDGKPLVEALRIVPLGGRRIALVGVVSPAFATPSIAVSDPEQAIAAVVAAHKSEFDALVILAYLPEGELEKLAAATPEADAVIGGPTGQAIVPRAIGPVLMAAATNKGKFLVRLQVPPAGGAWSGGVDELGPVIADDASQLQNLRQYLSQLDAADFPAAGSGFAPAIPAGAPADYRIAGSVACASCHKQDDAAWHSSRHAGAWQSLVNRGFHVDSYCQQCHTTGYGLPGGFESRSRSISLVGVGCESCHGPSAAHVHDPHVHTPFTAADQCLRCHDHENSPLFDRAIYWSRIRHGGTSSTQPTKGNG